MGSKPTKEDLKRQCEKLNLSTEGTVEQLKHRLHEHKDGLKQSQMSLVQDPEPPSTVSSTDSEPLSSIPTNTHHFIHLKTANFLYYLNYALILPVSLIENEIYRNENRRKDILTRFPDHIIVSTKPIEIFSTDDVMVEIKIDGLSLIKLSDEVLFTHEAIPVSRIKSAIFSSSESKRRFLADIRIYPDSFFPEELCQVSSKADSVVNFDFSSTRLPNPGTRELDAKKLEVFDRVLGMLSFMRNSGIIYAIQDGIYQEYTDYYFYALYCIYQPGQQMFERYAQVFKYMLRFKDGEGQNLQDTIFQRTVDAIYSGVQFNYPVAISLLAESLSSSAFSITEDKIISSAIDVFQKLSQQEVIFKDFLISDLFRRNYALLGLLFLAQFGNVNKSHMDKQAVRNLFIGSTSLMQRQTAEYLMGLLGLYYGYKNMVRADTNLSVDDNLYSSFAAEQQTIKIKDFHFIDRIVIESCFEFARTGSILKTPIDLSGYVNTKRAVPDFDFSQTETLYQDKSYQIFGTRITVVERKTKIQQVGDIILKEFPAIIPGKSVTLQYLLGNLGLTKKVFFQYFMENASKLEVDPLKKLIDIDIFQFNQK